MTVSPAELRARTREVWVRVLTPPRDLSVSQWADEERRLSPEYNAEAIRARGAVRWETRTVPYLRGVMDALCDPAVREVTFAKGAQLGATECAQNWIAWVIAERPAPMLVVYPTEKALRAFSTKRLDPMVRDCPALAGRLPRTRRRGPGNTIASKHFPGGYLQLLTARSTADLRSFSAALILAEELDEWEGDVGGQGDPLELLKARAATFEQTRKVFKTSTPLLEGVSRIWAEYEASSRGKYLVPCPACGESQELVWQDPEGRYRLICERDDQGELVPETARYLCGACGGLIDEAQKPAMLAAGQWAHEHPDRMPQNAGFHISTLYSPFVSWAEVMRRFLAARKDPARLKTFVNVVLGLPWREEGTEVEPHFLAQRAEAYQAEVPQGVGLLTAGVDVQGDRLELVVLGWGAGEEAWVIAWEQLDGDPGQDAVWRALDERLAHGWTHESGAELRIAAAAVDAGYQTERVVRYCAARRPRVIPTVGRPGRGRPLLQAPTPAKWKQARRASPLYVVGVESAKDLLLLSRLRITEPGPGYVHFPDTLDVVFYEQLTAERLLTVYRQGRPVRTWMKIPERRNEALDCSVLALAALTLLGPKTIARLGELAEAAATAAEEPKRAPRPEPQQRREASWLPRRGKPWLG